MIHFTSLQLEHWIGLVFWPFVRVLALLSTAPVFSATQVPVQVRVGLALLISVAIAPALPAMPAVHFLSGEGVVLLIQQLLIGFGLGFAVTLIFSVIQFSGSVISLQMGLGFSSFFDPVTGVQVPTLSNFLNLLVLLLFMGMNGQLLVLATLMRSFTLLPVSASLSLNPSTWHLLVSEGAVIFSLGLAISTPVLGTLILVNIALGILGKLAPQLNIFVIGFPLLLGLGLLAIYIFMPAMQMLVEHLLSMSMSFAGKTMLTAAQP
ncbi:flagellar biosynthetic protein FliR [Acidithiobacillus thiooxidans]|uniref:flagellar biosynthetic protein FliR n=1 Tax=Acidithiobacillus TaxID=119977 RepID=UPI0018796943|nr:MULTISPECIES: flagellar biosynthetic protein FliR [Acidithiobacillus]MBE7565518.1 flagellar biosynthetic protein FliR [Acidithiobacillus sp. HP-11]MBU2749453.1 flagellar biosynthetic protein FliR [Acidithiobacillus thiooxidans]MBU2792104.1 flagellar biosynthetic protein FliR [Acidithiobacillus thiooxidans]